MFKHYIITRFNEGVYGPEPRTPIPPDAWMDHRLSLFTTFTFASIAEQTCQNFTWLILMDERTPDRYLREIESFRYPNLELIFSTRPGSKWSQILEPGDHDLITTRLDNDDAFHRDVIASIQQTYLAERRKRTKPWVIVLPLGLIMDLASQELWVMEYWLNNCPTLVGNADGKTVYQWQHDAIPEAVDRCYLKDKPYWLQIVHAHNLQNGLPADGHPLKILHKEITAPLDWLTSFGVTPNRLPVA